MTETTDNTGRQDAGWKSQENVIWLVGGIFLFFVSGVVLLATGETTVPLGGEAEEGTVIPIWTIAGPTLIGLLLIRLFPPTLRVPNPVDRLTQEQVRRGFYPAIGIAVAFPVIVAGVGYLVGDINIAWFGLKIIFFLVVTFVLLRRYGGMPTLSAPTGDVRFWYWVAPIVVAVVYLASLTVGPFAPEQQFAEEMLDSSALIGFLLGATVWNFINAGLAEELFFRAYLQSRLEVIWGQWSGIIIAAILFAIMHAPWQYYIHWHGQTGLVSGDIALSVASVVLYNGAVGLVAGYHWSRYRNFWVLVLMHTGWNVIPLYLIAIQVI